VVGCLQQLHEVEQRLASIRVSLEKTCTSVVFAHNNQSEVGSPLPADGGELWTQSFNSATGHNMPPPLTERQASANTTGSASMPVSEPEGTVGNDPLSPVVSDAERSRRGYGSLAKPSPYAWSKLDQDRCKRSQHIIDQVMLRPLDTKFVRATQWARAAARRPKKTTRGDQVISAGQTQSLYLPDTGGVFHQRSKKQEFWYQPLCRYLKVPVIHPYSTTRLVWLLLGCFCVAYEAVAVPVYISFVVQPEGAWFVITSFMNTYFIMDLLLGFFTGFYNKEEDLVVDPRQTAIHYAKTWLLCDSMAAIPWEWLDFDSTGSASLVRLMKILRFFRLLPLLMKLRSRLSHMEVFVDGNRLVMFAAGISRVLICLGFAAHWCTCAWYHLGRSEEGRGPSWLDDFQDADKFQAYVWSLYFTITTMTTVGYGDITPLNYSEALFTLVLLPIASVGFAVLMGTLIDYMGSLNAKGRTRSERRSMLAQYMKFRMVPDSLKARLRQYLFFVWDTKEDYDHYEEELKRTLPTVLREELSYHLYGRILQRAPFLAFMKNYNSCVRLLASYVQTDHLDQGDHLFRFGQPNTEIHVLLTGSVWLSLNEDLGFMDEASFNHNEALRRHQAGNDTFKLPRQTSSGHVRVQQIVTAAKISPTKLMRKLRPKDDDLLLISGPRRGSLLEKGTDNTFPSTFEGRSLADAIRTLHLNDIKLRLAVRTVQRRWRERQARRAGTFHSMGRHQSRKSDFVRQLKVRMKSHLVHAPSYFGESCLWVPYDQWERTPPPTYLYAARCETRVELIKFARSSLQEVIESYSPWLLERFQFFTKAVKESVDVLVEQAKDDDEPTSGPSSIRHGSSSRLCPDSPRKAEPSESAWMPLTAQANGFRESHRTKSILEEDPSLLEDTNSANSDDLVAVVPAPPHTPSAAN